MDIPDLCPICLDDLPDQTQTIVRETRSAQHLARTVPCHHYYHGFCINEWAKKANSCPQCRAAFTAIELISNREVYQSSNVEPKKQSPEPLDPEIDSRASLHHVHQHSHLTNQLCCLCDRSGSGGFAICQDCSSGYHLRCLGVLEGATAHGRQRQLGIRARVEEPNYVALVDEQRRRQAVTSEDIAWQALDALQGGKRTSHQTEDGGEVEKFKRPKRAGRIASLQGPTQLSTEALAQHNKLRGDPVSPPARDEVPFRLGFVSKSLIQALLLKNKLKRLRLSTQKYTAVNKAVSRQLYSRISAQTDYMAWLNKMSELVERYGIEKRNYVEFLDTLDDADRRVAQTLRDEYASMVDSMRVAHHNVCDLVDEFRVCVLPFAGGKVEHVEIERQFVTFATGRFRQRLQNGAGHGPVVFAGLWVFALEQQSRIRQLVLAQAAKNHQCLAVARRSMAADLERLAVRMLRGGDVIPGLGHQVETPHVAEDLVSVVAVLLAVIGDEFEIDSAGAPIHHKSSVADGWRRREEPARSGPPGAKTVAEQTADHLLGAWSNKLAVRGVLETEPVVYKFWSPQQRADDLG
ncbi:hypothetical protein OGAPHI_002786 [Ogataea philodendri]|uniref:RING-type domain-containing protein n=1 Tax=Ogataea philodendri TaxID=1378263 RepID=A0A9P8P992_9ASCO|nr:uncharacterized protein OGAPHI_002786 [Ogataea philodendri]KAH3667137.1 hypothetical protein OGAPHI_002786 [Ogataea philodendri]